MEESLDMIEFLIKHSTRSLMEPEMLKLVGPVVRIANYPLFLKQKVRIMELLIDILKQKFRIDAFNNQIISVSLRLLQEFKSSADVIEVVAEVYFALLGATLLKQEFLLAIMQKLRGYDSNLMQAFYYLVKNIVKEGVELPKTLLEKIFDEVTGTLMSN